MLSSSGVSPQFGVSMVDITFSYCFFLGLAPSDLPIFIPEENYRLLARKRRCCRTQFFCNFLVADKIAELRELPTNYQTG